MEYMFQQGFLGTRAPLFMDMVTLIVALLPLILTGTILLAKMEYYKAHKISQITLFLVSIVVVGYFEYGVQVGGGFDEFIKKSSLSHSFVFYFLTFHITVAVITLLMWIKTIYFSIKADSQNKLPGIQSLSHIKMARKTILLINATAVTGIAMYLLLFVL